MAAVDTFINTCAACGAEESLDALLHRMIDDDQVRRLIADIMTASMPLGSLVVRYLRLHKPAKQKLRMDKVAKVLGELVPDMMRATIERKGRSWAIDKEGWKLALEAVFAANNKGSLTLPLEGNAYLYEVVMRLSDKVEGAAEKQAETTSRSRAYQGGAVSISDVLASKIPIQSEGVVCSDGVVAPAPVIAALRPHQPGHYARKLQAEIAEKLAKRDNTKE